MVVLAVALLASGVVGVAFVNERGAKRTGPNNHWWNVTVVDTGEKRGINAMKRKNLVRANTNALPVTVSTLVVTIPRHLHNDPECVQAKQSELRNWEDFGVFEEIKDDGQKCVNTNWVLVKKSSGVKARLCVRGDQEPGKDDIRTDSPTINKINIKLFYVIASHFGWVIKSADIKAAFLQGTALDRNVFVRPPKERRVQGVIWKMLKRVYGFVDASTGFYLELNKVLLELGCRVSSFDQALYTYFGKDDNLKGLLLLRGPGDAEFDEQILTPLKERFLFGQEEEEEFNYVGMHVSQEGSSIVTNQNHYVDALDVPDWSPSVEGNLEDILDEENQGLFRSLVGQVAWVSKSSRPDLAYDNLSLCLKVGNAS